ncbi:MAG: MFS transporter [Pseudomonadota bacterium]
MTTQSRTLILLAGLMAVAQLDRQILSLQLNAIGAEFDLSDTQLGLLSGLAFAVVFVLCGFPVARIAAAGNRRKLISIAAAVWSLMTMATAGAQSFAHLLLARVGVAVGESGSVAPAHSVISDHYPVDRRTTAMATFAAGANLGVLFAFLIGGVIGQLYGWRTAFICAGVPGLILALVFWRYGPEDSDKRETGWTGALMTETWSAIRAHKGLWNAMWGMAATGIVTFGALAWTPTFILRTHDLSQAQLGLFLALSVGVIGGIGTLLSGRLADHLGRRAPVWRIGVVFWAIIIAKPLALIFILSPTPVIALTAFSASAFLAAVFWGPTFAYAHAQLPSHQRPMATAIFLFLFNLVGLGLGPTLVGAASDALAAQGFENSLALALVGMHCCGLWGALHYWRVTRIIKQGGYEQSPGDGFQPGAAPSKSS